MSGCSHKERKIVVLAKELHIKCVHCKEVVHTRRRVLSSGVYALGKIEPERKHRMGGGRRPTKKITLEVQYMGKAGGYGKTFAYYKVPEYHYYKALDAKSIGTYIAELIKGKYEWDEVK